MPCQIKTFSPLDPTIQRKKENSDPRFLRQAENRVESLLSFSHLQNTFPAKKNVRLQGVTNKGLFNTASISLQPT